MKELLEKARSYRRFYEAERISYETLKELVNAARLSPSAANLQRLRFVLINDEPTCDALRSMLSFAGYLKDWDGPVKGECPSAYIVIMTEKAPEVNLAIDIGIAAEAMILTATSMGLGGCMFRSFSREGLAELLAREGLYPELVIALGVPRETVLVKDMEGDDLRYYRDEHDRHIVPKRTVDELIV